MTNPKTITEKNVADCKKMLKNYPHEDIYYSIVFKSDGRKYKSHEIIFHKEEKVVIKDRTFIVKYINESCVMLEPADCTIIVDN